MADADVLSRDQLVARKRLGEDLAKFNCRVHQPDDPPLFTRDPNSSMRPVHWRWSDLEPLLARVGETVELRPGGNRRTLRLTNPGLEYGTTPTFWGSIQYILPGEIATAHRHRASALRFIMKGEGAWTTVEGERYPMNEGDLVLTPSWAWHDHEHKGDRPMIWLDVLDISLVRSLHATFFEPATEPVQRVSDYPRRSYELFGSGLLRPRKVVDTGANPLLAYPATTAQAALREAAHLPPDKYGDTVLEYQNPINGGPAMATLGTQMQLLRPGFNGLPRRNAGSSLNYVVKGAGTTIVGDQRFDWSAGDFFVIPPWTWTEYSTAGQAGEALIFQVNDTVALKALGLYHEENGADDAPRDVVEALA